MKDINYLPLISKHLSGEISPGEAELLQEWIGQSLENERIFKEYSLVWEKSGGFNKRFSPDLDADFAKVQARMYAQEQPVLKVRTFNYRLLRAAAAVAILAAAVWGFNLLTTDTYFDAVASAQGQQHTLVKLADGTQVWLREGSKIEFPKSFVDKKSRRVKLSGEAYFDVAHDPAHPFRVELANDASVEVLGTQFDVKQSQKGTTVLVKSGKVRFAPNASTQSPVLTANQKAEFDGKTLKISQSATLNELSWQSKSLEFVKTPLSTVVRDLEAHYQVQISLENSALAQCPHTALLKDQPLSSVLEGLSLTYALKVKQISPKQYALSGGQCR